MVTTGIWQTAERMLREYGNSAQEECESRASYHEMQANPAMAESWRRTGEIILRLQRGEKPPG
jgi:hypothetical protein